ncbi:DNA polymerase I [Candidatus Acetothermia bacterium]|nr:DNA polymerase I [Candidatus Acetothermia bacterium]MBI3642992.1 DNA polymerase I [Candidatus Acetothermia bacterium]
MPTLGIKEEPKKKRLLLLDASSIFYPAYHVMKNFATRDGFPTGAIYGFLRTLIMLLRDYPSDHVAVVYDAPGKKIRHEKYEQYKATRRKMEDNLVMQVPVIKELVQDLGLPSYEQMGLEADDLIAMLANQARKEGYEVLIATGDKDLLQLVDDRVFILKPSRNPGEDLKKMGPKEVEAYMGVPPSRVRDYLALTGDTSDNIPGVPGIGDVTARKLLAEFNSLDELLKNIDRIKNERARKAIGENQESARLSYELVSLHDAKLDKPVDSCKPSEPNWKKIAELFERLEFRSFIEELQLSSVQEAPAEIHHVDFKIISDENSLNELCGKLNAVNLISLDLETTSEDDMKAEIVGIALAVEPGKGFYIPVGHVKNDSYTQLELNHVLETLRPVLTRVETELIGQNLKYDLKVLKRAGLAIEKIAFDSMLAAHLIDPASRKSLDDLALRYFNQRMQSFTDLSSEDMRKVPIEEAADYAAFDAEVVVRLRAQMEPELQKTEVDRLFRDIEIPLVPVLVDMELAGILVDKDILQGLAKQFETLLLQLQEDLFKLAGQDLNLSSPKQVAFILFEKLKLPIIKRTKTGPSTDADVLEQLAMQHPFPEKLLAHREIEKILNTYVHKLPEHIHPETGRIHTSYNQTIAATGRLSSINPNLQNIPIRSQLGGQVREAFIAPPGRLLLGADYSQIELRLMAHIAQDPGLIKAFQNDEDIHSRTASLVYGVPVESVNPQQRDLAKRINFGLAYGMGSFGLAQSAKISRGDAQKFIKNYFESYPGVKVYMDEIVKEANEQGYVKTLFGRRRYFQKLDSRAEREAINMPLQGSAADLMKLAMINVDKELKRSKLKATMLLQIHDELIFEVDESHAERCSELVKNTMENVMKLNVPLKADTKVGKNWGEI